MPGTIKYLDLTLPSPEENLALDEALLDVCDAGGSEVMRFWESPRYFVVVGYGCAVTKEANENACMAEAVPILRRSSGGGTVLQGPGCLSYALAIRLEREARFRTISGANEFIMNRNRSALAELTGFDVRIEGHTDLAINSLKFSGNAQRRKRHALLFHGTFLLGFDMLCVERFLQFPNLKPAYRGHRTHREFLRNLNIPPKSLKAALRGAWKADSPADAVPLAAVGSLVTEKYSRDEWNLRR